MKFIEDEVIGEFLYQTVEFTQKEFADKGIGVISQVAVRQYLIEERPDLKIKKLGSFKFDSQKNTVTVRIATVNKTVPVALLNPGYDELKAKYDELQHEKDIIERLYDALVVAVSKDTQKFSELLQENEKLKVQLMKMQLDVLACPEDAADLANAKEVFKSADSVPLSEIEVSPCDCCGGNDCGDVEESDAE